MSDPVLFPDNRIKYSPTEFGSPSELRGEKAGGWKVRKQVNPYVILDTMEEDGKTPSLLEKLIFYGNVETVDVEIKKHVNDDFESYRNEPIDVSKGPLSFADGFSRGIKVYAILIKFLTTKSDDADSTFDVRFDVFACIEGR